MVSSAFVSLRLTFSFLTGISRMEMIQYFTGMNRIMTYQKFVRWSLQLPPLQKTFQYLFPPLELPFEKEILKNI